MVSVEVVVNAQRQREQEQEVREGQVQVKNTCGEGLYSESEEGQDVGVGGDAHHHGQDVGWRYDPRAEHSSGVGFYLLFWVHNKPGVWAGGPVEFIAGSPVGFRDCNV